MRTFHSYGQAIDPTVGSNATLNKVVTDLQLMPPAKHDPEEPTDKSVHRAIQSAVAKQGRDFFNICCIECVKSCLFVALQTE